MKINKIWMLGLGLSLTGCPGDDSPPAEDTGSTTATSMTDEGSTTGQPETTTSVDTTVGETDEPTTGGPEVCLGTSDMGAAVGEACTDNDECMSGVCTIYTDAPLNDDAVCAETPADCATRVTGTVLDFVTREPVSDASVVIAGALQAATNPTGAMAIIEATSGADGRIDATSTGPITMVPLGIVALSSGGGYYLTSTGVAAPGPDMQSYEVGTGNHDIWVVPEGELGDWSDALAMDAMIDPGLLPLGDAGGVVGFVRDADGMPLAGATVTSTSDTSSAIIRYLQDDGSFDETMTSDLGIFIILDPSLPEDFEASVGGMVIGSGTAGSANNVLFTLIITGA